jgi:spore maturation protein CgeB
VSNRIFEALASGAFLLHQTVAGLEELTGLQAGVHYVEWTDFDHLHKQIKKWLQPRYNAQRERIAAAGRDYVRQHHSFDMRVKELFAILEGLREHA